MGQVFSVGVDEKPGYRKKRPKIETMMKETGL